MSFYILKKSTCRFSILDHFQTDTKHILDDTDLHLLEVQHDHSVQFPAILINEQLPGKIHRNTFSTQVIMVKIDCDLALVLLPLPKSENTNFFFRWCTGMHNCIEYNVKYFTIFQLSVDNSTKQFNFENYIYIYNHAGTLRIQKYHVKHLQQNPL